MRFSYKGYDIHIESDECEDIRVVVKNMNDDILFQRYYHRLQDDDVIINDIREIVDGRKDKRLMKIADAVLSG